MPMTWLVAGLGNPGSEYAETRHNVGQMVVDSLAKRNDAKFRRLRPMPVEAAEFKEGAERIIVARSTMYMNESGPGFASLAKRNHLAPHQVIAVHDEIDLPFGRLQVKRGGSTAGHHGLGALVEGLRSLGFGSASAVRRAGRTPPTTSSRTSPRRRRRTPGCSSRTPRTP
jgi:peptidyl-tRNA hydrolase, PTH1 family